MKHGSNNHPVDLMGQPRRVAACMACSEVRELAAFGQCNRGYRAMHRDKERARSGARVDRHVTARQKRENKIVDGLATSMKGLTAMACRMWIASRSAPFSIRISRPPN